MRISSHLATRTLAASCGLFVAACSDDNSTDVKPVTPVTLKNQSVTPALVKSLVSGVEIYSLVSSDDVLAGEELADFDADTDKRRRSLCLRGARRHPTTPAAAFRARRPSLPV